MALGVSCVFWGYCDGVAFLDRCMGISDFIIILNVELCVTDRYCLVFYIDKLFFFVVFC